MRVIVENKLAPFCRHDVVIVFIVMLVIAADLEEYTYPRDSRLVNDSSDGLCYKLSLRTRVEHQET